MNKLKAIYCRVFQKCFHIAIPFMPYRQPKVFYSTSKITGLFEEKGISKALIVTDAGVVKLGLMNRMLEHLEHHNIGYAIYDKTVPNPTTDNVEEARTLYINEGCEAIIGFGGGSSMDCAKAIGARIARPKKSLSQMGGILKVGAKLPLLVAVPTTAGTGSETTLAAIITDSETRHKYAINDFPLIPRYAVLDPKITVSLPKHLTSTTGMDALTHAVEAYIGRSTTYKTRKYALLAVKLIFEYLDNAYENGQDLLARRHMLEAAYYAGCAFTVSYVGYVHAVAHSIGGKYNIPHGLANATLLPTVLEEYGETIYDKLYKLADAAGILEAEDSVETGAVKFIEAIKNMKKRYGIGDTFAEIQEKDIHELAKYADKEANPLYPVPVLMDAKELEKFYYMLMEEK